MNRRIWVAEKQDGTPRFGLPERKDLDGMIASQIQAGNDIRTEPVLYVPASAAAEKLQAMKVCMWPLYSEAQRTTIDDCIAAIRGDKE